MAPRAAPIALLATTFYLGGCAGEEAEGRPSVHDVRFIGNHAVKSSDLADKISIEKSPFFLPWRHHYLDPFALDLDRQRIEAYYHTRGYFSAKVLAAEARPHKTGSVDVEFTVSEGSPTKIVRLQRLGLETLYVSAREYRSVVRNLPLQVGQRFDHARYLQEKHLLEDRLRRRGYAWAEVKGQVEVDRTAQSAEIVFTVTPGPVARLGEVTVEGTARVDAEAVRRRAGLLKGARFSPELLEAARGRLYNLGLFSLVKIDYRHAPDASDVADVVIAVKEGKFHELRLGGGIGLESERSNVHLGLYYTKHNFLGGLRNLNLRFIPSYIAIPTFWNPQQNGPGLNTDVQLSQPDLGWHDLRLTFTIGYDLGVEYSYRYHGPRLQLGLSRPFWENRVLIGLSYNFQFLDLFDADPVILSNPSQAGRLFGYVDPYRLGFFQADVALDFRDRPLDAHQGAFFGCGFEFGGPYAGGAFRYEKFIPDVRVYAPLGRHVTFAARMQYGRLLVQGAFGSPVTRRFYLGGPDSHRGFSYGRLSLQVPSGIPGVAPIPIGGDESFLVQGELRAELFRLASNWLSAAVFLDAGDVAAPQCTGTSACPGAPPGASPHIDFGQLYYAVGGGLRYKTVIGTVRIDVGVRLNRLSPTEPNGLPNADPGQRIVFHLSVGEAF